MLTFPEGRPWSRAAWVAIAGAYAAAFGGQLVGAFVLPDSRDVLSTTSQQTVADAVDRAQGILGIAVALAVLFLLVGRLLVLRGPAQRAQAPLLAAACLTVPATLLWLVWVSATDESAPTLETIDRALSLLVPLGVVAGIVWSRLRRREASDLVVELRTEGRPACASASPGYSATRRSTLRIASTTAATSTPPENRSSSHRTRTGRSRW